MDVAGQLVGNGAWPVASYVALILSIVLFFGVVGYWVSAEASPSPGDYGAPKKFPGPDTKLTAAELAKILGNTVPDDEDAGDPCHAPRSTGTFGNSEAVDEELVTAGVAADDKVAGEALLKAMEGDDSQLALRLVRDASPAVINYVSEDRNALLVGAMEGHVEACRALLGRSDFLGANLTNNIGSTALHLAAANDHVEICKALIACPRFTAGINAENVNGLTPLDFSHDFGEGNAARVLEAAGGQRQSSGTLRERRKMQGQCLGPDGGPADSSGPEMSSLD